MLKQNEGKTDRVIRVLIGVVLSLIAYFQVPAGTAQVILYVLSLVSIITGLTGFCGLYQLLGINTSPRKK